MYVQLYRHSLLHPGCCSDYDVQHTFLSGYHTRIESQTRFVTHRYNRPSFGSSDRAVEPWDLLRAVVAHGERGEHKPRNGDRIHTSVPVYSLMVLRGHREGVALLVVWHHSVRLRASGRRYVIYIDGNLDRHPP